VQSLLQLGSPNPSPAGQFHDIARCGGVEGRRIGQYQASLLIIIQENAVGLRGGGCAHLYFKVASTAGIVPGPDFANHPGVIFHVPKFIDTNLIAIPGNIELDYHVSACVVVS
jgi:hypothetical protein